MKSATTVISFFALYLPVICLAHPGHGESGGYTITHYFTEPMHMFTTLIIVTGAYIYNRYTGKNKQQKQNN